MNRKEGEVPCALCQSPVKLSETWRIEQFDRTVFYYCSNDCLKADERSVGKIVPPIDSDYP